MDNMITIASTIFIAGIMLACAFITRPKNSQSRTEPQHSANPRMVSANRAKLSILQRPWFVLLLESGIMAFVLYEVLSPGHLTKPALYRIVFGVGAFFFVMLQSSVSRLTAAVGGAP